jgi:hypothetical protein
LAFSLGEMLAQDGEDRTDDEDDDDEEDEDDDSGRKAERDCCVPFSPPS